MSLESIIQGESTAFPNRCPPAHQHRARTHRLSGPSSSLIPVQKEVRSLGERDGNQTRKPACHKPGASPAQDFAVAPALCWRKGAFTHDGHGVSPRTASSFSAWPPRGLSHWRGCEKGSWLGSAKDADSGEIALEE